MRRPQSAFGLVAVMSSLLVVTLFATPTTAAFRPAEVGSDPAPVLAASTAKCTKWSSQFVPPTQIRVLRTSATDPKEKVLGTVQTVDFHDYVATVMAAEWPEHYPVETLKVGAIAVKQFAWYYILNPRGGTKKVDGVKVCYDVVDSTIDQYYKPQTRGVGKPDGPGPKIMAALDATWDITLRKYKPAEKSSRMFLTGYRAGSTSAACGADSTGWKLYHNSTRKCGNDGLTFREILRAYLSPNLEIVQPGAGDVIGSKHGDATAMEKDSGRLETRAWTPGRTPPESGSDTELTISTENLVKYRSADMNGDGKEDLVWLKKTGATTGKIRVALSDGVDYKQAQDWWAGDLNVSLSRARLLLGDFNASGRIDVAVFGKAPSSDATKAVVLRQRPYSNSDRLKDPLVWWSGHNVDIDRVRSVWAGDLSGDGRADLIVRDNPSAGGARLKSAVTKSPLDLSGSGPYTNGMATRWQDTSLPRAKVKMIVGDANRDGRADVITLIGGSGSVKIDRFQGQNKGGFKRVRIWTAPKSDPIPIKKTKLGTADIDYDGRSDLVLYSERDNGKTRIRVLKTRYTSMVDKPNSKAAIFWSDIYPY